MTQQEWPNTPSGRQPGPDDGVDLAQLTHAVWRRRHLVLALTLVGALAGLGASSLGTRYVSRGLLLMPGVSVVDYKRYEAALTNEPRLERFLESNGKTAGPLAEQLRLLVQEPGQLTDAVKPMFSFTDRDAKQFGVKVEEGGGELVGIDLSLRNRERPAESPVLLLAEYVRDTAISVDLEASMLKMCLDSQVRQRELRNEQLDSEFQVSQLEVRAQNLRKIIASAPHSPQAEVRQVVSIENGGDRFLPPATQLASTEIAVGDHRSEAARRERDRLAAQITEQYYCEAHKLMEKGVSGRRLLEALGDLQKQALAGHDLSVNVVERTANAFELKRQRWTNTYVAKMRFVASPEGALKRVRIPGRIVGTSVGTILGGGLGVVLAVLLGWWRSHRDEILADGP